MKHMESTSTEMLIQLYAYVYIYTHEPITYLPHGIKAYVLFIELFSIPNSLLCVSLCGVGCVAGTCSAITSWI